MRVLFLRRSHDVLFEILKPLDSSPGKHIFDIQHVQPVMTLRNQSKDFKLQSVVLPLPELVHLFPRDTHTRLECTV